MHFKNQIEIYLDEFSIFSNIQMQACWWFSSPVEVSMCLLLNNYVN